MTPTFAALLAATCTSAATIQPCQNSKITLLVAAAPGPILPTPAAKVLDVGLSTASETALLLIVLKVAALLIKGMEARGSETLAKVFSQLTWLVVVQGSARLAGMVGVNNQIARPTKVLNPAWYESLAKPSWNPPPWAFPLAWIPLKILQTFAANLAWTTSGRKVLSLPIVLFVSHIALGDGWNAQFFLKQRPLTGVFVISFKRDEYIMDRLTMAIGADGPRDSGMPPTQDSMRDSMCNTPSERRTTECAQEPSTRALSTSHSGLNRSTTACDGGGDGLVRARQPNRTMAP